jgi:hypothetical protein
MSVKTTDSCRDLFKDFKILPSLSQYIFSLPFFVINNKDQYKYTQEIQSIILDTA